MLDYEYKPIVFDFSRQKELDTDAKEIQQIDFGEQLSDLDADGSWSMFSDFRKN